MWTELAEAKKGDRLRDEASIIWAQLNSELQEECLRAVNNEKQRSGRDVDRRRDFQAACREFFTRDIEENVIRPLAHCKGFIPSTDDIFTMTPHAKWSESQSNGNSWLAEAYTRMGNEMRVKGNQRVAFPENGPDCKYTALFDRNPCFDPLRTGLVEEMTIRRTTML